MSRETVGEQRLPTANGPGGVEVGGDERIFRGKDWKDLPVLRMLRD